MKHFLTSCLLALIFMGYSGVASAADYVIDTKGGHASIQFRVKHLGYSWLTGRFNTFEGSFTYDPEFPQDARIEVLIDPASIDSNHAERDKHLRGKNFLNIRRYKTAKFVGAGLENTDDGKMTLSGELTLHGRTKPVQIQVEKIGQGKDPWGGYRTGFSGVAMINTSDFGMKSILRKESRQVELLLHVEGIRQ